MNKQHYIKKYPWLRKLSEDGKKYAIKHIKDFEALGFGVPTKVIFDNAKRIK